MERPVIRLVVSDVDGTLLAPAGTLSAATARAVQALSRQGIPLALCTARPPRTVKGIHARLGLQTPVAAYNGALIYLPGTGEHLIHHALPRETGLAVLDVFHAVAPGANMGLELQDEWHVNRIDARLAAAIASGRVAANPQVSSLVEVVRSTSRELSKVYLIAGEEERREVRRRLEARLPGRLAMTSSGEDFLEVSTAAANKGEALRYLAGHLDIPLAETAYLGDAENDLLAIEAAGLGIAMGQAPRQVQAQAHMVAPSNVEDGWAWAVARWVLGAAASEQAVEE